MTGETEPVDDPLYWARRLEDASDRGLLHQAVFRCPLDRWRRIEAKHREILARLIEPGHSILDAGCAWGRLLKLLPEGWQGNYLGIDISSNFVRLAQRLHPEHREHFFVGDAGAILAPDKTFHWAVLISVRPMIRRNLGEEVWARIDAEVHRVAERVLFLEYDHEDEGSVE